jgi:hypothetical protein
VVAIVKSGQQLFNEAALKSQNEGAADADAPDIAMAALFNMSEICNVCLGYTELYYSIIKYRGRAIIDSRFTLSYKNINASRKAANSRM